MAECLVHRLRSSSLKDAIITPGSSSVTVYGGTGSNTVSFTYTGDGTVSASSSNTEVATVAVSDNNITVTYVAAGSATITISAPKTKKYKECSATVSVICERSTPTLSLSATSGTIYGGGSSGAYTYSYNGDGAVSASSSNTGVATVALSGNNISVSYVAPGSATVTVSAPQTTKYNAVSATIAITCSRTALTKPSLTQTSYTVNAGTTCTPGYNNYNSNLMTVSGTTSASSAGSYTIYFDLRDTNRYCWSDGSTGTVSCAWSITIKTVTFYIALNDYQHNTGNHAVYTCNAGLTFNSLGAQWIPAYRNGSYVKHVYLAPGNPNSSVHVSNDERLNTVKYPLYYTAGSVNNGVNKYDAIQSRLYYTYSGTPW